MKDYALHADSRAFLRRIAEPIGYGILLIAMIQGIMTTVIPIGPASNPPEVYIRNISTVLCEILLGYFFIQWTVVNGGKKRSIKRTNMFKFLTLLMTAASVCKAAISAYLAMSYLQIGNKIFYYYLGEVVVWGCCAVFFAFYFLRLKRHSTRESSPGAR